MDRRFILAALAAFAASFALSFIFHGLLLAREYEALTAVLAQLVMAFAMVAIYRYGHEQRPYLGQGIRFGLMAAGLSVIPCYLIGYAVTNIPASLAVKQVVLETIIVLAMAVIVAWFYRR
jgi:drug/metabolite transporter (DMT)-like permease